MSSHAATAPAALAAESTATTAGKALTIGIVGLVLTALGLFVSGAQTVAMSYLVGITYWTAMAIGMLLLVLIHHIVDAGWSVVIRRQFEHGLSAFKWLAVLFLPLMIAAWMKPGMIWPWMDLGHELHGGHTVGADPLYLKKSGFLNLGMFTGMTIAFFVIWIFLSWRLRKASFSQDADGEIKWTRMNRRPKNVTRWGKWRLKWRSIIRPRRRNCLPTSTSPERAGPPVRGTPWSH
jgi:hypothetical protein